VLQQLGTLQELTGQSQQRLSELRSRLANPPPPLPPPAPAPADTTRPAEPSRTSGNVGADPDQMYDLSLQQYRRGSFTTARLGFREFLRLYPTDERASDALYYVGESFATENADSAATVYQEVA
jgi:TolA-binding protein